MITRTSKAVNSSRIMGVLRGVAVTAMVAGALLIGGAKPGQCDTTYYLYGAGGSIIDITSYVVVASDGSLWVTNYDGEQAFEISVCAGDLLDRAGNKRGIVSESA
jgi:hypothetical protein